MRCNDFDVDAAEADTNMKRRVRCSVTCSISRSAGLVRLHSEGTGTHEGIRSDVGSPTIPTHWVI